MDQENPEMWTLNPICRLKQNFPNNIPNELDYWEKSLFCDLIFHFNNYSKISNSYLNFILNSLYRKNKIIYIDTH